MISLPHESQTCRRRSAPRAAVCAALATERGARLPLARAASSWLSVPVLRSRASEAPAPITASANAADATAAECQRLRAEIRSNQQAVREAPTTSTSPQIVAAAQAQADKRIDDARARLDELNCPSEGDSSVKLRPLAPLPPAPGAASP